MADNGEVTIVGVGARLEGNVVSAGSLRIDGQVKGQINADGELEPSPQSQVQAHIRAQNSAGSRTDQSWSDTESVTSGWSAETDCANSCMRVPAMRSGDGAHSGAWDATCMCSS